METVHDDADVCTINNNYSVTYLLYDAVACCFNPRIIHFSRLILSGFSVLPFSLYVGPPLERSSKRKRGEVRDDSDEETQSGVAPPVNDIYRARQQKRAHTTNSNSL